jgi:N utilization substance protein A
MNGDFLLALQQIAKEKDLSPDALLETVETALLTAARKYIPGQGDLTVKIDSSKATFRVISSKLVVEGETQEPNQISLSEARERDTDAMLGEKIDVDVTPSTFGRIAAQTAKQVILQRIREAERDKLYEEYNERVGEVLTGTVSRREFKNIIINLGKVEAVLPPQEQVPSEPYRPNDRIKVYLLEVRRPNKGTQVLVSRTHPSLVRRLFELEVPEIADGIVTIKSVAREPGARSKIAVFSRDEKVHPVGSCVGHHGARVQAVVNELYDEKIDIIQWSPDIAQFIAESLSPAKAVRVTINEEGKSAFVVVPDNMLSLAIGKSGQNVRLAARLTGWRIDIRSESQVARATLIAATTPREDYAEEEEEDHIVSELVSADAVPETHGSEDVPDDTLPMIELPDFDMEEIDEEKSEEEA